jgi:hypothetical protein
LSAEPLTLAEFGSLLGAAEGQEGIGGDAGGVLGPGMVGAVDALENRERNMEFDGKGKGKCVSGC